MAKSKDSRKEKKKPKKEVVEPGQTIAVASSKGGVNINKPKE